MNSASNGFCSGTGRVMMPGFQFSPSNFCVLFLFPGWNLDSPTKYAFGILGAFLFGVSSHPLVKLRSVVKNQALKTFIYGAHMVLAYFMMLLVMLYEIGIFIGLVGGLMVGFAITSYWSVVEDESTPCCSTQIPAVVISK